MEIAIPLIALGGMYVVSNQSNENCADREIRRSLRQEKFTNMGIQSNLGVRRNNGLPNTNIPQILIQLQINILTKIYINNKLVVENQ